MNQSTLIEESTRVSETVEKPIIKAESVLSEELASTDITELNHALSSRPLPPEMRRLLDAVPDSGIFDVEKMKEKYMKSLNVTEKQYDKVAEEMVEEAVVLG